MREMRFRDKQPGNLHTAQEELPQDLVLEPIPNRRKDAEKFAAIIVRVAFKMAKDMKSTGTVIDNFVFNDYCLNCQKVTEHKIAVEVKAFFGVCGNCGMKRAMTDLNQVYYPRTDLWVTRFKIGNLPSVVAGKLLNAVKRS